MDDKRPGLPKREAEVQRKERPADDEQQADRPPLQPVSKKIRESDDNLRQRSAWYRKRSGVK
jgi:hypothetical protein